MRKGKYDWHNRFGIYQRGSNLHDVVDWTKESSLIQKDMNPNCFGLSGNHDSADHPSCGKMDAKSMTLQDS